MTFTSCKDYDDDISRLDKDLADLKASAVAQSELTALQTQLTTAISAVQADLNTAKTTLATLQANAATKAELDAAKAEVLAQAVKLETFNTYKAWVDGEITTLKSDVAKAATKVELTALQTLLTDEITTVKNDLAAKIANLEAILKVADGKSQEIENIKTQLAEQLEAINENKADIEATKADLQAKYNELSAEITALKVRLTSVESGLATLDTKVNDIKTATDAAIDALEGKLDAHISLILNLFGHLDRSVRSLVFEPDYSSGDGTPQIVVRGINEWYNSVSNGTTIKYAVKEDGTIYKGVTNLKYKVNPSNATLNDFEVSQLLNKVTIVRSTSDDYLVLTDAATLQGGILTVPVLIGADVYNDYGDDVQTPAHGESAHNHHVALEVKILDDSNEDKFVASEYVKVNFDLLTGRIALNANSEKTDGTLLPVTATGANIAAASYDEDVVLWNGKGTVTKPENKNFSIDLKDYVYGVFGGPATMKMLEYGFNKHEFTFELVELGTEGVDQSNTYVILNGSTLKVKPATGGGINQAAVGRTPIILVKALVNGKIHAVGFIKVLITDEYDNSPVEFEFTLDDYMIDCDNEHSLTNIDIDEIDFDQVFNHARIMLGKDAFFAAYRSNGPIVTEVISDPVSATGNEISFEWNITQPTQGGNLANYIKGTIANTAPAGTYVVKTTLQGEGIQPDVEITWNFKVVLPTGISLTANTIYYKNGGIVVNPTIMEQGALTSTAYEALLNNTFMHESNSFVYTGLTEACQEYLTPYFVFTEVPTGFTISNDKKSVWKGSMKAAEIVKNGAAFYLRLETIGNNPPSGPWGNHPPFSDAAKQLVGKTVKVQPRAYINGQPLNVINLFDPFTAHFTYPLTLQFPDDAEVFDQANDGVKNSYTLNLYDPTVIKDWNGKLISVLTPEGRDLIAHYEIDFEREWIPGSWHVPGTGVYYSPFVLGEPQINLNPDGTIGDTYHPIPQGTGMKIEISQVEGETYTNPFFGLLNTPASITLTWDNSATGAVQNEFKVRIPVSVKHKWSPDAEPLRNYLHITVKPGNGN
ncbi:MAG: Chromosome partition protein Smc [Bacteroidetes bacterium ADurb.BinA261]|nr:MAG: Chromosome partition protein Smc [Bacteroidetes bacterium ADurb.BinA261]